MEEGNAKRDKKVISPRGPASTLRPKLPTKSKTPTTILEPPVELALLSSASMFEERLDEPSQPRPDDSATSDFLGGDFGRDDEIVEGGVDAPTTVKEGNLKLMLNLDWDDIEKRKHEEAQAMTVTLVEKLRAAQSVNERNRIVSERASNNGKV